MTALLFLLEPDRLSMAMDTCTLDLEPSGEKAPGVFCSKMLLLPHLQTVICGTGSRELILYWYSFLQQSASARNVTELDNIAQEKLPGFARLCGVSERHTGTIYHFGYWSAEKRMIGLVYRSTEGFISKELQYGLGAKPPAGLDLNQTVNVCNEKGIPVAFIETMKVQKALDDALPLADRVGIGGEIQFLEMDAAGFALATLYRFEDYEQHFEAVRIRIKSRVAHEE